MWWVAFMEREVRKMIQGYRTIFDQGGLLPAQQQADPASTRRADPGDPGVTGGPGRVPATGAVPMATAETSYPVTATAAVEKAALDKDTSAGRPPLELPLDERAAKLEPTYKEPKLPQLSAEALATALMNLEPELAVVPRVLPSGTQAEG